MFIGSAGMKLKLGALYFGGGYGFYNIKETTETSVSGSVNKKVYGWYVRGGLQWSLDTSKHHAFFVEGRYDSAKKGSDVITLTGIFAGFSIGVHASD